MNILETSEHRKSQEWFELKDGKYGGMRILTKSTRFGVAISTVKNCSVYFRYYGHL